MSDTRRLLVVLQDYEQALLRHLEVMRDRHAHLTSVWGPTHELYQGSGAEVFAEAMERANARFRHLQESSGLILSALRTRIESLQRFDSPSTPQL